MKKEDEILKILNVLVVRVGSIQGSLQTLEFRFDKLEKEFGERFDRIEERLNVLEERFVNLEIRFDKLEERFNTLEMRFDVLENRFNKLEEEVINLKKSVQDLEERLVFKIESVEYIFNGYFQKVSKDHANLHLFVDKNINEIDSRLISLEEEKIVEI